MSRPLEINKYKLPQRPLQTTKLFIRIFKLKNAFPSFFTLLHKPSSCFIPSIRSATSLCSVPTHHHQHCCRGPCHHPFTLSLVPYHLGRVLYFTLTQFLSFVSFKLPLISYSCGPSQGNNCFSALCCLGYFLLMPGIMYQLLIHKDQYEHRA